MFAARLLAIVALATIMLPLLAFLMVWKLPQCLCERARAVRYYLLLCVAYYLAVVVLGVAWLGISTLPLTSWFAVLGLLHSLPLGPVEFLSSQKRRAVLAALSYQEGLGQSRPLYNQSSVVAVEPSRCIICITLASGTTPLFQRYLAVNHASQIVDELGFEYVASRHGVRPRL
jgi:hypothetical protein